ncbi:hypothetical protein [Paracoccus sulfuroxidans]|uniref:Uncharacterized protein n=1 Tax=Paracoccus sulfuroxidans TaxID=384678 RepID=A0A562NKL7_9RHOB|nr:hypothetical protein [Paracoccus sulfuroxidans]TWI32745.1 hypothetical protein IQ24_02620 [Paracoccus sulfuroxidans]
MNHLLEHCRPFIEAALRECSGTHSFDDVAEGIASGKMQLWPAEDACAVTEIAVYPQRTMLNCFLAGGSMERLKDMAPAMEAWAEAQGCDGTELTGRHGWARALSGIGYKPAAVVMRKDFGNGRQADDEK